MIKSTAEDDHDLIGGTRGIEEYWDALRNNGYINAYKLYNFNEGNEF